VGAYQLDTRCATVERNHLMAIGGKTRRPGPRSPDAEPKTPLALQGGFPLAAAPVRRQRDESEDDMAKKTARGRRQDRARVAGGQDHEVRYEAKKTGKSKAKVRRAVKRAGPSRKRVERAL
jgi:hypothetical protein